MVESAYPHETPVPARFQRARDTDRRWSSRSEALTVVIGEPDDGIAALLSSNLESHGYNVVRCADGGSVLVMAGYHHPDALILAEELTEVATATVVSIARTHFDCPIVIGTGDASVETVGASLLAGASHVVRRPYDAQEVVLTLRRLSPMIDGRLEDGCLRLGRLELSTVAYRVTLDSRELALPLKAFQLLRLLMLHSDRVVSRDEIRHELWGDDALAPDSNAIAVRIRDIREALRDPGLVRTVRGLGYRLDTASLNA